MTDLSFEVKILILVQLSQLTKASVCFETCVNVPTLVFSVDPFMHRVSEHWPREPRDDTFFVS